MRRRDPLRALAALFLAAALAASAAGSANAAELETFELPSPHVDGASPGGQMPGGRTAPKIHVRLPDGYDAKPKRRWPVLWLLHGANGGTDSWLSDIEAYAKDLPAIVVMPDGGKFGMYMNWWNGGVRGRPAWTTYHLRVLLPLIERRYRIRPARRWHAIGGISMGGQGTLRYASMLPGYFGSAVGLSPAIPNMQSAEAQVGIVALIANGGPEVNYENIFGNPGGNWAEGNSPHRMVGNLRHTRVYLTAGNGIPCPQDPVTDTFALDIVTESAINAQMGPYANALRGAGAEVVDVTTCGVHTFGVWDRAFPAAREWGLFKPVAENPRRWSYRTIHTRGEMWGLRYRFAAQPEASVQFERKGRTLTGLGEGKVRIRAPRGCRLRAELPFEAKLPRACRRAQRV